MKNNNPDIEFVSYSGEYPCLCYGTLILKVNGKNMKFGIKSGYPKFWVSGGDISFDSEWNESIIKREWDWHCYEEDKLPTDIVDNKEYVMELFNDNVPWGCCGGCI